MHSGVRPERLQPATDGDPTVFAPVVEMVEPVGSDVFFSLRHDGQTLMVKFSSDALPILATSMPTAQVSQRLRLFDIVSGNCIGHRG